MIKSDKELIALADKARERSYCPYSGYSVGAALLTKDGKVYTGANIENASFTPTVCAERVALFSAVHSGEEDFEAIAVVGGPVGKAAEKLFTPCGVCRQVLSEFCKADMRIIIGASDKTLTTTLGELLPYGFGKESM
jgi:cytidine deaminase